ncbi:MAG: TRAP transporter large permease [Clostridia bacterium]|nr:TRAP transporter large permease [Clostridia bacterium]
MLLVFIVFLILLFLGVPVAISCGLAGIVYFLNNSNMIFNQVIQQTFSSVQSPSLLAIPMFIFAGNLMNASGITHRLLGFCGMLTRRMYGGMAQTSVLMSTFMGGISGSSVADAAMESRILGPNMLKHGYSRGYTGVVIGFTSLITSTIPPGNNLILYGTSGEVSIGKLFTAGLSSGLLMMVFLLITVSITSHRKGYMPHSDLAPTLPEILAGIVSNFWALLFPIILLVGIRLGWFTASEVGAFACVYALFCGFIAYRELGIKQLGLVLRDSVVDIAAIVFLIALTGPFGYGIAIDHIPQTLTAWMTGITTNPFVVQLIVVIVLLIMGCFMEGGAVILILTPILLPMVESVGVDPVFFGIVMATTCVIGILTPPVGLAMYIVTNILEIPLKEWVKESAPFFLAVCLFMVLILAVPDLIMWLPKLIYGS